MNTDNMTYDELVEFIHKLPIRGFKFTKIGEYIFTDVSEQYPLCSLWEFKQMLKLPQADYYINLLNIDYSDLKSLVRDLREQVIYDRSYGLLA